MPTSSNHLVITDISSHTHGNVDLSPIGVNSSGSNTISPMSELDGNMVKFECAECTEKASLLEILVGTKKAFMGQSGKYVCSLNCQLNHDKKLVRDSL